jgi:hypothetical protein
MEHFEHFIQRENIAIFKRRLAETKDASIRGPIQRSKAASVGGLVHLWLTQGRVSVNPPGTNASGVSW